MYSLPLTIIDHTNTIVVIKWSQYQLINNGKRLTDIISYSQFLQVFYIIVQTHNLKIANQNDSLLNIDNSWYSTTTTTVSQ